MKRSKLVSLARNVESRKVVTPKPTTDFPEAVVREGADELTLRADEEGALRTPSHRHHECGRQKMGGHRSDEDWHVICQAIFQWVEGSEWETMYFKYAQDLRNKQKRQRHRFPRSGQCPEDSNKIASEVGPLSNPPEEPDSCPGGRTGTCRSERWNRNVHAEKVSRTNWPIVQTSVKQERYHDAKVSAIRAATERNYFVHRSLDTPRSSCRSTVASWSLTSVRKCSSNQFGTA